MKGKKLFGNRLWIPGVVLLLVICIGAAELLACYFFAPALYQKITEPVRSCVESIPKPSYIFSKLFNSRDEDTDGNNVSEPAIPTNAAPFALTEFKEEDGLEILTGGVFEIVYYNQADEAWANKPFGSDNIGGYGCGPVAMSMVISSMTDEPCDPIEASGIAVKKGCWAPRKGSALSIVGKMAENAGLKAEAIKSKSAEGMQEALSSGSLLVALMGPGHFTSGGHFIVIRGVTLTGSVLIADPNSRERSLMEWDAQLIIDELSKNTGAGGPLWVISN